MRLWLDLMAIFGSASTWTFKRSGDDEAAKEDEQVGSHSNVAEAERGLHVLDEAVRYACGCTVGCVCTQTEQDDTKDRRESCQLSAKRLY